MPQARKRLTLPVCRPAPGADTPLSIADVTPTSTERIIATVRGSDVPNLIWSDRGLAPSGYAKGMAVAFARVYAKWKIRNSAALVMAAANSGDDTRDALSWYNSRFQPKAMDNTKAGADTLRHLFVLLFGLGMRESSGRYCEGRDRSARNISADSAEAGLFQMSWDAHTADAEILRLFGEYRASQDDGLLAIFREGVTAHQSDLESYGSGDGRAFQDLCKSKPLFAVECAAVGLRAMRRQWGPINRHEAVIAPSVDRLFAMVQAIADGK